jgi:hypothetical protein
MFPGERIVAARSRARGGVFAALCAKIPGRAFFADKPWLRVHFPRVFGIVLRHPRDAAIAIGATLAVGAIVANSLFMQSGPHPAPIFAIRPPPVVAHESTGTVSPIPLARPAAIVKPEGHAAAVPVPRPRPQFAAVSAHPDPIADLLSPSRQVGAIQRALNDYGYGPVKVSGTLDDDTRGSIERFEGDQNLPVTGLNTPRLRRALSIATGRPLD